MNNNQKGFGVIEVITVTVIVGVVIAAGLYIWKHQSRKSGIISSIGAPIQVPPETSVSTNCYTLNMPQKEGDNIYNVDGPQCTVDVGFANGSLDYFRGNLSTSETLSSVLKGYKSEGTGSVWQITVDGQHGVCITTVSLGAYSTHDALPAQTEITCTFVTNKVYSIQDYKMSPKTFTSNSFNLDLTLYTTNQTSANAIANSIINSIRWK